MANKQETKLQNQIRVQLCERGGGICIRQNSGTFYTADARPVKIGFPGLSDLLYIAPNGVVSFIEVKIHPNRPTPEQVRFIQAVQQLGHRAGVAYSVDDALKISGIIS